MRRFNPKEALLLLILTVKAFKYDIEFSSFQFMRNERLFTSTFLKYLRSNDRIVLRLIGIKVVLKEFEIFCRELYAFHKLFYDTFSEKNTIINSLSWLIGIIKVYSAF